jgi:hypothetical protein
VYNEFSPGNSGNGPSFAVRAAIEFPLFNLPWMYEGDLRQWQYPHNQNAATPAAQFIPGCVATPGDQACVSVLGPIAGTTFVPAFTAREYDFDGRIGLKVADPRIYIGVGYMYRTSNFQSYPKYTGVEFGAEKLPDLDQSFSVYGSIYYAPNIKGDYTVGQFPAAQCPPSVALCASSQAGQTFNVQYQVLKYTIGGTFDFGTSPLYLDLGFMGDRGTCKTNCPIGFSHNGGYAGLGVHF